MMLRLRVISAIVMLAVVASVLFVLPDVAFTIFVVIVAAVGAWEWANLSFFSTQRQRLGYAAIVAVAALLFVHLPGQTYVVRLAASASLLFWAFVLYQLVTAPVRQRQADEHQHDTLVLISGGFVLVTTAVALNALRFHVTGHSIALLLYVLSLVWVMDIGAYFAGKRFGKNKLAPLISPGKTREGVVGGLCAALMLLCLALVLSQTFRQHLMLFLLASVLAALISVVGDLYESRLKRARGIKDSSRIIPGHGGVLDRIDGVVAAVPVFLGIWIWA